MESSRGESSGMMGQAQIDGEADLIRAANKKAKDRLDKEVADGQVLTLKMDPRNHGEGPFGNR